MSMLDNLRKKLAESKTGFTKDHSIFTFWNLPTGGNSVVRLLPYEDSVSHGFWTEKKVMPLSFVDPEDDSKILRVMAPCREMYDRSELCPVLGHVRALYKEAKELKNAGDTTGCKRLEDVASAHWIKPTFYYQGFVEKPGMTEEEVPENPIRVFPFLKKIHQVINNSLTDEDIGFELLPTGEFTEAEIKALLSGELDEDEATRILTMTSGFPLSLKKTQSGEHANYQTSTWLLNKEAHLSDEHLEAIAKYGLHDLRKRLPNRPSDEQYDVYEEMMQVSIGRLLGTDEGLWNPSWEEDHGIKYFKPKGDSGNAQASGAKAGGTATASGKSLTNKLKKQMESKGDSVDGDAVTSEVMKNIRTGKGRSVKAAEAETPEAETPEVAAEAEASSDDSSAKDSTSSALAARIKGRLNKANA